MPHSVSLKRQKKTGWWLIWSRITTWETSWEWGMTRTASYSLIARSAQSNLYSKTSRTTILTYCGQKFARVSLRQSGTRNFQRLKFKKYSWIKPLSIQLTVKKQFATGASNPRRFLKWNLWRQLRSCLINRLKQIISARQQGRLALG